MTVQGNTGGKGTAAIRTDVPFTEGLELGTTKLSSERFLRAEEGSIVSSKDCEGI